MEQVEQHDEYRQDDIAYCSKGFPHVRSHNNPMTGVK